METSHVSTNSQIAVACTNGLCMQLACVKDQSQLNSAQP